MKSLEGFRLFVEGLVRGLREVVLLGEVLAVESGVDGVVLLGRH